MTALVAAAAVHVVVVHAILIRLHQRADRARVGVQAAVLSVAITPQIRTFINSVNVLLGRIPISALLEVYHEG